MKIDPIKLHLFGLSKKPARAFQTTSAIYRILKYLLRVVTMPAVSEIAIKAQSLNCDVIFSYLCGHNKEGNFPVRL